jgi:membrane-associated phospholipid phosphatase
MLLKRHHNRRRLVGIACATCVGLVVLPWDLEIWRQVSGFRIPGDLRKSVHLTEVFAHAFGVTMILVILWWIDVKRRDMIVRAAVFTAICGIFANAAKYLVPRYRPHSLEESPSEILTSWDTWGSPFTGSWFDESMRSFPSGHSATAIALAIGLYYVYPRGKWIFVGLALLACFQRLLASAHFLSDIMGGILVTLLVSGWFWRSRFGDVLASTAEAIPGVSPAQAKSCSTE